MAFLTFARGCVLKKLDGLDEEQLRRRLVVSDTNLLGLVQHLTGSEDYWFSHTFAGEPEAPGDAFEMVVAPQRTSTSVVEAYRSAIAASDAHITAAPSIEALTAVDIDDAPKTLRWVIAHMTGETLRHAGHADILRELIDGTTGR